MTQTECPYNLKTNQFTKLLFKTLHLKLYIDTAVSSQGIQ